MAPTKKDLAARRSSKTRKDKDNRQRTVTDTKSPNESKPPFVETAAKMRISLFKDVFAREVTTREVTHEEFLELVRNNKAKNKARLPLYNGCEFGDVPNDKGCLRHDDNVICVRLFVGDYDGEKITMQEGAELFRKLGVEASFYSTPSSLPGAPRWRVTSPLRNPKLPDDWRQFVKLIQKACDGIFASKETNTLSLSYYLGNVDDKSLETAFVEGGFIDEVLETNSYLNHDPGDFYGMDVDASLAAMTYRDKDHPIHNTQLRCVASMLNRGVDEDEVIDKVMKATERACEEAGQVWDMRKELKAVGEMCRTWIKKLKAEGESSNVVDFKVLDGGKNEKTKITKKELHVRLAQMYLDDIQRSGRDLIRLDDEWWSYTPTGTWIVAAEAIGNAKIERGIDQLMKKGHLTPTQRIIRETVCQLKHITGRDGVAWDAHGMLHVKNGLLDLKTRQLRPVEPGDYSRRCLPVAYDPEATCPVWKEMLAERFGGDVIRVLQENLGAALLPVRNKDQRRALIIVGGSNSGKSAYLSVVCGLLAATTAVISTSLEDVSKPHGTMQFRDKFAPWCLHEAFKQGAWHETPTIKALLSGEPIEINLKNGPRVTVIWEGPCFWGSNYPVQFREATKAMVNRVLIVDSGHVVFDPEKPVGAALIARDRGYSSPADLVVAEELSGVLNWALEGADRLAQRGHYDLPKSIRRSMSDFVKASNPVVSFFEDCVEFDPNARISVDDLHYAFASFVRDDMRNPPSSNAMGRYIFSMGDPRVAVDGDKLRSGNTRFYAGIKLNDRGLDHWSSRAGELVSRGQQRPGASHRVEDVNGEIPVTWNSFEVIKKMREHSLIRRAR
jgi:P4 family phage/plasmid primase-like protien